MEVEPRDCEPDYMDGNIKNMTFWAGVGFELMHQPFAPMSRAPEEVKPTVAELRAGICNYANTPPKTFRTSLGSKPVSSWIVSCSTGPGVGGAGDVGVGKTPARGARERLRPAAPRGRSRAALAAAIICVISARG